MADLEKYLSRTERSEGGCLNWLGYKTFEGYGRVFRKGKVHNLHRVIWSEVNGAIPDGLVVRHKCDNPSCINPDHLELGSHADNGKDKALRGRSTSKLADEDVLKVKAERGVYREIAEKYGISPALVCLIKSGKRRQHVEV